MVIGYLRTQTSQHLGHPLASKEYQAACASAAEQIKSVLLPALAQDKVTQQAVVDTLSKACGSRLNEAFGEYLILIWVRYGLIQVAIARGQVTHDEATFAILSQALLNQIKRLADQKS